jgi:outer membrane scaffolding protein for murein synthesis (MipA/OmpV family)
VTISHILRAAAFTLPLLAASPVLAQDEEGMPDDPNSLTIGIGGAYVPSYEGSDDYELTPIGIAFGKVAGFGFATRGTGLSIDLIRDDPDAPFSVELGPLVHVRLDRTGGIKDPRVRALGELDRAIELGGSVGIKKNGLLHKYDSLGFRLTYQKDVSDTHDSSILTPAVEYQTPLSTHDFVQLGLQAERVGDGYARTYFGVGPSGAAASGLPAYNADGGWKNYRLSLLAAHLLTGDLRHPGFAIFGGAAYSHLLGDFRRSPIVAIAGSPNQYFATVGLSYTF